MKMKMKLLKTSLLLLAVLCLVLSTQSCKDECDDVLCQNGGTCNEGNCDCPDGFSGPNCEIEDLCFGITCENNGTCVDGTCDCLPGYTGDNCENFDTTQIQFLLDGGKTPKELFDGGIILDSLYGKIYEEGIIFYLNTDNGTGLVAATSDQSDGAEWGCYETNISGLNNVQSNPSDTETEEGAKIGDGAANTIAILAECTDAGIAAKLCRDLGEDWFLPSRGELNLMYTNLHSKDHGMFTAEFYWSSTEHNDYFAWHQFFAVGGQIIDEKTYNFRVRAARAF